MATDVGSYFDGFNAGYRWALKEDHALSEPLFSPKPDWWVPSSKYLEPPYVDVGKERLAGEWMAQQLGSGWRLDD